MELHTVISRNGTSVDGHTKRADHADNLIRHTQTNISLLTQADTTSCSIQIKLSNNHVLTLHILGKPVRQIRLSCALSVLFSAIIHTKGWECKYYFKKFAAAEIICYCSHPGRALTVTIICQIDRCVFRFGTMSAPAHHLQSGK